MADEEKKPDSEDQPKEAPIEDVQKADEAPKKAPEEPKEEAPAEEPKEEKTEEAPKEEEKEEPKEPKEKKADKPKKETPKEAPEEPKDEPKEDAPEEKGGKIEAPSEKVYEIVEAVKASGKIKKGINEVTKSIERGEAKLVVVAKDISPPEVVMHLPLLCKEKGIPYAEVDTREELGAAAGLDVPSSCIAVVVEGEAKESIKELSGE